MDAIQQHMIDAYRAAQHGELAPPLPGRHDLSVLKPVREHQRFVRVLDGCPVRPSLRTALARLLRRRRRVPRCP
ncbi:hypothetical protein [Streptomyces sp. NPDC059176]|uniref:hypothetical protein n=1 Tax=unclassified Streptomyces TaxID=2593676 RepID=UPI0036C691E6